MDHLCYLCLVFVMLLRLVIAALWSPVGKGLTSWLLFVTFNCIFITFLCASTGQVWHLIVSIPDLYHLTFFDYFSFIVSSIVCMFYIPSMLYSHCVD